MRRYIDIRDCIELGAKKVPAATVKLENGPEYNVQFASQKTGFGEKTFLVCPVCGSRRTKLYVCNDVLVCRDCYPLPVYSGIKNVTPGGYKYIAHRMHSFAKANGIQIKRFPFIYLEYEKPKYKHFEKWHDAITKLQALENMRNQAVFFRKIYPLEVVNSIFEDKNIYLYVCELYDLDTYFYDWEKGYEEFKNLFRARRE